MKEDKLFLSEDSIIGKGYHKTTYFHPMHENKCIKVLHSEGDDAKRQLEREIKYNIRLKNKKITIIPQYYGTVDTNLGTGYYVFDLIKDYDGKVSLSLESYIYNEDFVKKNYDKIVHDIKIFKQKMLDEQIVTMKLFPGNILYRKKSPVEWDLIIIDDIGTAVLIPLEYYLGCFAKARVRRKWQGMIDCIKNDSTSALTKKLADEIS